MNSWKLKINLLAYFFLFWPSSLQAEKIIEIKQLLINPSTLEIQLKEKKKRLTLSKAQKTQKFSNLKQSSDKLEFTRGHQRFVIIVKEKRVHIEIQNIGSTSTDLYFPSISTQEELILPMLEGIVVSNSNRNWLAYRGNQDLDLIEAFSFPGWGVRQNGKIISFVRNSGLEANIHFSGKLNNLNLIVKNKWPKNALKQRVSYVIDWKNQGILAPADLYRTLYHNKSSSLSNKIKVNPKIKKLLGAFHIYLWGGHILESVNVLNWKKFLDHLDKKTTNDYAISVIKALPKKIQKIIVTIQKAKRNPYAYEKREITEAISIAIKMTPLPETPIKSKEAPNYPDQAQAIKKKRKKFASSFPSGILENPSDWGNGVSSWMAKKLKESGIDTAWLGLESFDDGLNNIEFIQKATQAGFLVGAYDSYHSMHDPKKIGWPTANIGKKAFTEARIVDSKGKESKGFLGKGFHVNSKYIRSYFEKRTSSQISLGFNSWFIDCDGAGELYSHYGKKHPMKQVDDLSERVDRLKWLESKHAVVVGTEGARAYAVPSVSYAHGTLTPPFTYSFKPIFQNKKSKSYIGGWYPDEEPPVMFKNVVIPKEQKDLFFDPRFQIPLFERAFHDQIISTHHWEIGTLKFSNIQDDNILRELLYGLPPLLHLNRKEWAKHGKLITRYFKAASDYLRKVAKEELLEFSYLSKDKLVQKSRFSNNIEVIVNFSNKLPYTYNKGKKLPTKSAIIKIGKQEKIIQTKEILTGKIESKEKNKPVKK